MNPRRSIIGTVRESKRRANSRSSPSFCGAHPDGRISSCKQMTIENGWSVAVRVVSIPKA
jgi:hypothetical protein